MPHMAPNWQLQIQAVAVAVVDMSAHKNLGSMATPRWYGLPHCWILPQVAVEVAAVRLVAAAALRLVAAVAGMMPVVLFLV